MNFLLFRGYDKGFYGNYFKPKKILSLLLSISAQILEVIISIKDLNWYCKDQVFFKKRS